MATATNTGQALSIGKLAGLRRLADEQGIFCITAMDQRHSLKTIVDPQSPDKVTPGQLTDIKLSLAAALSPHSTAVLLDPQYGAPQAMAAGALDPHAGLLVTLEGESMKKVGEGLVTQIAEGFSAQKIGRMGGDAVKLLVRYRPDLKDSAQQNQEVVQQVAEQCRAADLPFVLEAVAIPVSGQSKEDFAKEKPGLVIQSAKDLSRYCDLYKAEFPVDLAYEKDRATQLKYCQELDRASVVPWVLLSAGADIGPFSQAVEVACEAGASGFLAGRAIWKDYVRISDPDERLEALETKAVYNLEVLTAIARRDARPWTSHPGHRIPGSDAFQPNWYQSYE
jgi:tagatose 1,6-diphosphate aldolase